MAMRKVFLCVIMILIAVSLIMSGCSGKEQAETEAKAVFNKLIAEIQKNDMEKAGKYIDIGAIMEVSLDDLEDADLITNAVFKNLKASITACDVLNNDEVLISANMTTVDLMGVFGQSTQLALNEIMTKDMSDEEIEARAGELFKKEIQKENLPTVANRVDVKMIKTNEGWKLEMNPEFRNAISGGFFKAIENAKQSMGN